MSDDRPTRRDLMKPVQLLGLAFGAALFAGLVTLVSMGFFQQGAEKAQPALMMALIVAGITFIAVLLIVSLLLLAVDPAQVAKTVDKPVLLPEEGEEPDAEASGSPKS